MFGVEKTVENVRFWGPRGRVHRWVASSFFEQIGGGGFGVVFGSILALFGSCFWIDRGAFGVVLRVILGFFFDVF